MNSDLDGSLCSAQVVVDNGEVLADGVVHSEDAVHDALPQCDVGLPWLPRDHA